MAVGFISSTAFLVSATKRILRMTLTGRVKIYPGCFFGCRKRISLS